MTLRCRLFGHRWEDVQRYGHSYQVCSRCKASTYVDANSPGWPPMPHPFPPHPEPPFPKVAEK